VLAASTEEREDEAMSDMTNNNSIGTKRFGEITGALSFAGDGLDIRIEDFSALVHSAEEGGYWAEIPALPGCLTQGETLDEIVENLEDAIQGWLSVQTIESLTAQGVPFTVLPAKTSALPRMPRVRTLELAA